MRRSTVFLLILGVLVVTAAWWLFIIGPRNTAISSAEDQLFTAEQQGNQLRQRISRLNEIKDQEISYLFALGEMESSIPSEPEFDTFLEDLTFLAERAGVELTSVSASPPVINDTEGEARLFEIQLSLAMEGQFFEILGFLFGLEEMERLIRVDAVSLNPVEAEEEETESTTTTTLDPDASTSSTTSSSTTSTTLDARARPEPGLLSLDMTATLFTRTPILVPIIAFEDPGQQPDDEGEEQ